MIIKARGTVGLAVLVGMMACSAFGDDEAAPPAGASSPDGGPAAVTGLPIECLTVDPVDRPECVADGIGVFVDPTGGDDANDGSKAKPVRTMKAAFTRPRRRFFLCAGTFTEPLVLTSPTRIDGGFACGTWAYDGSKVKFAPPVDRALRVEDARDVVLSDLELVSAPGVTEGESSVAASAVRSQLTLRRVAIVAGAGKTGKSPAAPTGFGGGGGMNGNPGVGADPGPAKICLCSTGGTTTGGGGAIGASTPGRGLPTIDFYNYGNPGIPGQRCPSGGQGIEGSPFLGNVGVAPRAPVRGELTALGFVPGSGSDGPNGAPGQGGGGGAGEAAVSKAGGSGGCGGCGGFGGKGGQGGGASIGLTSFESEIVLVSTTIKTSNAGDAGHGAGPSGGGLGGTGGAAADSAVQTSCSGGKGGSGEPGKFGGAGAGGISVGVLHAGTAPTVDELSSLAVGAPGNPAGDLLNGGLPGLAASIQDASKL